MFAGSLTLVPLVVGGLLSAFLGLTGLVWYLTLPPRAPVTSARTANQ